MQPRVKRQAYLQWFALICGGAFLGLCVLVYIVTGLLTHSWDGALTILEGEGDPFKGKYQEFTVTLSILGYLVVPTTIAVVLSTSIQMYVGRRFVTRDDFTRELDAMPSVKTEPPTEQEILPPAT